MAQCAGQPSMCGRLGPSPYVVHHGPWGAGWSIGPHGPNTRSTHDLGEFLHDPMVQIIVDHHRMAEDDFGFDQMIDGLDVHDRTALVKVGHDRMAMDSFRID